MSDFSWRKYAEMIYGIDRARELARNDSYIARYLNLMVSNVIGKHGVRISSKSRNDNMPEIGLKI